MERIITNPDLTYREREVAELLAWGATKAEIGQRLELSSRTVERFTASLYKKIGINKVSELSMWWFCTNYHISFDLSPIKRQIVAVTLLMIVAMSEAVNNGFMMRIRTRETNRTEYRIRREDLA